MSVQFQTQYGYHVPATKENSTAKKSIQEKGITGRPVVSQKDILSALSVALKNVSINEAELSRKKDLLV